MVEKRPRSGVAVSFIKHNKVPPNQKFEKK